MLYAFFDGSGALLREAFTRQVAAAAACGASGVAALGLGTEVAKLSTAERRDIVRSVIADAGGRLPVAITVADGNLGDAIESARFARGAGAAWLILQPPRPPAAPADLIRFFGAVADAVDCPIAIQNAPEYLGIGLTAAELVELNRLHPNVGVVKAEASALQVARLVEAVGDRLTVLNGRAGLELPDNYRAGVAGMIPGIETVDRQVRIGTAMREGNDAEAEALYRTILPALTFIMQGVAQFVLYGKLIAALRLGLAPSADRIPSDTASPQGLAWAARYAAELGPLPA